MRAEATREITITMTEKQAKDLMSIMHRVEGALAHDIYFTLEEIGITYD